jgi:WD40 repeat protein
VVRVDFHPDGDLLYTASWDGTTRLWNSWTGQVALVWVGFLFPPHFGRGGYILDGQRLARVEVAAGREYRTLVSSLGAGKDVGRAAAVSPDGRLLSVAMDHGVCLWDLAHSREVAFLPLGRCQSAVFRPDGRDLLTAGVAGLQRWPIRPRGPAGADLSLGVPRTIRLPVPALCLSQVRDGKTAAAFNEGAPTGGIIDLETEAVKTWPLTHPQGDHITLSPDGRWAATAGWHATSVKIWDARTGRLVKDLPLGKMTMAEFTPDGKALVTSSSQEYRFWEVGSWEPGRRLERKNCPYPTRPAFSLDGRVMALELTPAVIHLVEA